MNSEFNVYVYDNNNNKLIASLQQLKESDLQSLDSKDWLCSWLSFWNNADLNCEAFVKLTMNKQILGLIHFALYPYNGPDSVAEYLEILHIECLSKEQRKVNPVGFWLIWYATYIALDYCQGNNQGDHLVVLDALESAIDYYRDKVKMEEIGWVTIAPGEDAYAFKFTQKSATTFRQRIEQEYGIV